MKNNRLIFIVVICFFAVALHGAEASRRVLLVQLEDDIITPVVAEYIINAIAQAESESAACLVIELDTPGGLLNATRSIVKKILNASVPVVVYVAPGGSRAASAGVFITMAAHVAAMSPSTNIGAAHPVNIGGESPGKKERIKKFLDKLVPKKTEKPAVPDHKDADKDQQGKDEKKETIKQEDDRGVMGEKIVNDTVAWIRTIARTRGRNEQWGEQSVRESVSVTEQEALSLNVIDLIAKNRDELLRLIDGKKILLADGTTRILHTDQAPVMVIPMSFRQRFLNVLANPNLAYILMILGFYGLLYEFTHPGIGFPGIAGAISLILAFYSMQTLPTNYAGVALIILALLLFVAEAWVPSFGLLSLGGITAMILGSVILFDSPADYLRVSLNIIIPFAVATAGITFLLLRLVVQAQRKPSMTGMEGMIGAEGIADGPIDREGKVYINGEIWQAHADDKINDKEKIKVVRIKGLTLYITKKKED